MSQQSAKPYLVRALYEWCVEQGYTPHLAVRVNARTRVPTGFVKDGEIVLNIGPLATHQLTMDTEWILFNARFGGASQEVAVPFSAVVGIFAKETGYGMGFEPGDEALDKAAPEGVDLADHDVAGDAASAAPATVGAAGAPGAASTRAKASHLKVVK
ncbi:MAG: ClpXP protease specificity-enhancing factor [Burkholderiales bacterium]|nr:ClpXP protease specificity-enhancing factor [Burkholderiales bacterium]